MAECPSCGQKLAPDARFCHYCGAALPAPSAPDAETAATVGITAGTLAAQPADDTADTLPAVSHEDEMQTAATGRAAPAELTAETVAWRAASASRPTAPPPPPQRPTWADANGDDSGRRRNRIVLFSILGIVIVAAIAVALVLLLHGPGDTSTTKLAQEVEPLLAPVAAQQQDLSDALTALNTEAASLAVARDAAKDLARSIEQAQVQVDGLEANGQAAQSSVELLRTALRSQAVYAAEVGKLPDDPADLTTAEADVIVTRASSAREAYAALNAALPGLPSMAFPPTADARLVAVAQEVEQQVQANAEMKSFLQSLASLFPQSQGTREQAEQTLANCEDLSVQADAAAAQMSTAASDLQALVGRINSIVAPDDAKARAVQSEYARAVQDWVDAGDSFAKWMRGVWDYYQTFPPYPTSGGLEADSYSDPSYVGGTDAQDAAFAARQKFASDYDALASRYGVRADWTESDL